MCLSVAIVVIGLLIPSDKIPHLALATAAEEEIASSSSFSSSSIWLANDNGSKSNNDYKDNIHRLLWSELLGIGGRGRNDNGCSGDGGRDLGVESVVKVTPSQQEAEEMGQDLVFGELSFNGIQQLIHIISTEEEEEQRDVLLDFGSGTATATLMAPLMLPNQIFQSIGIEYARSRHLVALNRLERLATTSFGIDTPTILLSSDERIRLFHGNFLDIAKFGSSYKEVTVIFCNSLAFSEETKQALKHMITDPQLFPKIRLTISGIKFDNGISQECYQQHFDVSWGSDTFALWVCHFW